MGVDYQHIVLYGYEFPYDLYDSDRFADYHIRNRSEGEVVAVPDGRSGDYLFVGILELQSDNGRHGHAALPIHRVVEPGAMQRKALDRALSHLDLDPGDSRGPVDDAVPYVFTHHF